jgi:2',3'-cyclic-nucleotide 2'-phosphodiesterase (5'-nucleotidase family)
VYDRDLDIRQLVIDEVRKAGTLTPSQYAQRNWTLEPATARAQAFVEQTRGRSAEAGGGRPTGSTASVGTAPAPRAGQRTVRVIAMSDFHAALRPQFDQGNQPVGGAVALSAAIRRAQADCVSPACEHVVIDAGDLFTGTPASDWNDGRPTVDVVNRLDVAAGALGNHEFDFGQDTLRARLRGLRHAVLGANVRGRDGRMPSWVSSDTIVDRHGVRIGIVGAAGTHTTETASRRRLSGLTFLDPVPVFAERVKALRASGAQMVIAVIHDGGRCDRDRPTVCTGSGIDVGRRVAALGADRPDVYVMGHAHVNMTLDFDGMPAVEPTSSGRGIVVVDVPLGGGSAVASVVPVSGTAVAGAHVQMDSIVQAAVASVAPRLAEPVTTLATPMRRSGPQNAMGNLLADAMRSAASTDIGMWNNGGIRAELKAGPLTYGDVHYVTPFANIVTRVRVRGATLLQILEAVVDRGRPDAHVSGMVVVYDAARPQGARIVSAVDAAGKAIDPARIYSVAMNDFMVENDFREQVAGAVTTEFLNVKDIDAVAEYLRRQPQPVRGDETARIRSISPGSL